MRTYCIGCSLGIGHLVEDVATGFLFCVECNDLWWKRLPWVERIKTTMPEYLRKLADFVEERYPWDKFRRGEKN